MFPKGHTFVKGNAKELDGAGLWDFVLSEFDWLRTLASIPVHDGQRLRFRRLELDAPLLAPRLSVQVRRGAPPRLLVRVLRLDVAQGSPAHDGGAESTGVSNRRDPPNTTVHELFEAGTGGARTAEGSSSPPGP